MIWIPLYFLISSLVGLMLTTSLLAIALHSYRRHSGPTADEGTRIMARGNIRTDACYIVAHLVFIVVGINYTLRLARLTLAQAMALPSYTWDQWLNLLAFVLMPSMLIYLSWSAAQDLRRAGRTRPPPVAR